MGNSAPGTAAAFKAALVNEGLNVIEYRDWSNNFRPPSVGAWGNLYGSMMHHTAGDFNGILDYLYDGDQSLPGPLCHAAIMKNGDVYLIGWGRANHAGGGDPTVATEVMNESYGANPTPPQFHQGEPGAADGNTRFVGFECVNLGDCVDPWPAVQVTAMKKAATAVARLYGWSAKSAIAHFEWSDQKIDPACLPGAGPGFSGFRASVQTLLNAPAPGPIDPNPPIIPATSVSCANIIESAKTDPKAPQGATTHPQEVLAVENALVQLGYLDPLYADGSFGTKTVTAYACFQQYLGYVAAGADGIPGCTSLKYLGLRTGLFTTTP